MVSNVEEGSELATTDQCNLADSNRELWRGMTGWVNAVYMVGQSQGYIYIYISFESGNDSQHIVQP